MPSNSIPPQTAPELTQPEWKTPERPAAGERWLTRLTESILILALIGLVVLTLFLLSARVG